MKTPLRALGSWLELLDLADDFFLDPGGEEFCSMSDSRFDCPLDSGGFLLSVGPTARSDPEWDFDDPRCSALKRASARISVMDSLLRLAESEPAEFVAGAACADKSDWP